VEIEGGGSGKRGGAVRYGRPFGGLRDGMVECESHTGNDSGVWPRAGKI